MRKVLLLAIGFAFLAVTAWAEERVKTKDGKEVILRDDGTWIYAKDQKKPDDNKKVVAYVKDKKAELAYTGKNKTFKLSLVPDTWVKSTRQINPVAEVSFGTKEDEVFAMIVAEQVEVPIEGLRDFFVNNLKKLDENAKVLLEEKRLVNGQEYICVTIDATIQKLALTYHVYLYTGKEGSFQVLTWTTTNFFKKAKPKMEQFLNGFEIIKMKADKVEEKN